MYTITSTGQVAALGDRVPKKSEQVFSDTKTLYEALTDLHPDKSASGIGTVLVRVYNQLPGARPVKKFENTHIGLERIVKQCAIAFPAETPAEKAGKSQEQLRIVRAREATAFNSKPRKAKAAAAAADGAAPREGSAKEKIVRLLTEGTTRQRIQDETGWQAHSVRGFLSTYGKTHTITVTKLEDKTRVYKLA